MKNTMGNYSCRARHRVLMSCSAQRLRRRLAEKCLVSAREATELIEAMIGRYFRHGRGPRFVRPQRAPDLMQLPQLQISLRARGVHIIEGIAQTALADAGHRRELRDRDPLADVRSKELFRAAHDP